MKNTLINTSPMKKAALSLAILVSLCLMVTVSCGSNAQVPTPTPTPTSTITPTTNVNKGTVWFGTITGLDGLGGGLSKFDGTH